MQTPVCNAVDLTTFFICNETALDRIHIGLIKIKAVCEIIHVKSLVWFIYCKTLFPNLCYTMTVSIPYHIILNKIVNQHIDWTCLRHIYKGWTFWAPEINSNKNGSEVPLKNFILYLTFRMLDPWTLYNGKYICVYGFQNKYYTNICTISTQIDAFYAFLQTFID